MIGHGYSNQSGAVPIPVIGHGYSNQSGAVLYQFCSVLCICLPSNKLNVTVKLINIGMHLNA